MPGDKGNGSFTVNYSGQWVIESDNEWLTLSQTEGKGHTIVNFEVQPNHTSEYREAKIKIYDTANRSIRNSMKIGQVFSELTAPEIIVFDNDITPQSIDLFFLGSDWKIKDIKQISYMGETCDNSEWVNATVDAGSLTVKPQKEISKQKKDDFTEHRYADIVMTNGELYKHVYAIYSEFYEIIPDEAKLDKNSFKLSNGKYESLIHVRSKLLENTSWQFDYSYHFLISFVTSYHPENILEIPRMVYPIEGVGSDKSNYCLNGGPEDGSDEYILNWQYGTREAFAIFYFPEPIDEYHASVGSGSFYKEGGNVFVINNRYETTIYLLGPRINMHNTDNDEIHIRNYKIRGLISYQK